MGTAPSAPELKDQSVKRGKTITFSWEANCGVWGEWKKDGVTLTDGDRISITRSKDYTRFQLTIRDAREGDGGQYTLRLWNKKGDVSGSANVTVLEYDVDWRTVDWGEKTNKGVKRSLVEFKPSNPEVKDLRFLLHGPVGAGKSSIVNSIKSTFQGRISVKAPVAAASGTSFTKIFTTHKIKDQQGKELPFVFSDIMGLENTKQGGALSDDIISIIRGHVRENYQFNPTSPLTEGNYYYNSSPNQNDKVHCLVSVIPADKISLLEDTDAVIKKMRDIREAASILGIPQVVFVTHVDACCSVVKEDLTHVYSSKKMKQAMQHCSNKFGVPMNCIFPVKNYNEENRVNVNVDSLILNALQSIVTFADDYVGDN